MVCDRETTQEQIEGVPRHSQDEECVQGQEEISMEQPGGGEMMWELVVMLFVRGRVLERGT